MPTAIGMCVDHMADLREQTTSESSGALPFVPAERVIPELTLRAVIAGTLLGMVFGASSLYLVLKVGLTVSASIPVAVISLSLFRLWSRITGARDATILENNIVQTAGSAGESIAFGLGATMPAILILGFELEATRVMLVGLLGALLGILMMIPLRRALIVAQHGTLKYPEGTACAEVLKAGAAASPHASGPSSNLKIRGLNAATIFTGFGIGLAYNTLMKALKLWKDVPEKQFSAPLAGGSISVEITPELLGVGYIIGPKIGSIMMAGGVLSYLVIAPMIKFFGQNLGAVLAPGSKRIADMSPDDLRGAYILYIGAGCVAAGGIISLVRSLPLILSGLKSGLADFKSA
ncbi:MAG TPA: OPT/YSL family transporter, partial [Candidatus Dormibacteraeota bacterium]|nr:OPT/YSL family transporter [Candidatus Dormibacteraeota bacterium]